MNYNTLENIRKYCKFQLLDFFSKPDIRQQTFDFVLYDNYWQEFSNNRFNLRMPQPIAGLGVLQNDLFHHESDAGMKFLKQQ